MSMVPPPPQLAEVLGLVIAGLRRNQCLSQEKLADRAELHRTYVSLVERGRRQPTVDVFWRIALALGMKPSALVLAIENKVRTVAARGSPSERTPKTRLPGRSRGGSGR